GDAQAVCTGATPGGGVESQLAGVLPRQRLSRGAHSTPCPAGQHLATWLGLQRPEDSARFVGEILGDRQARRQGARRKYLHHSIDPTKALTRLEPTASIRRRRETDRSGP